MNNNELLRQLRRLLAVNESTLSEIYALSGHQHTADALRAQLRHENEEGFAACTHDTIAHLLDAIIKQRRDIDPNPSTEQPLSNNQILKKLRIAYELKDDDMHRLLESEELSVSKQELKSLFRKEGHKNYRACPDKTLVGFLKALTQEIKESQAN